MAVRPTKKTAASPRKGENSDVAYTPYGAFRQVFMWLCESGNSSKVVTPQLFYNYTKGRIAKGKDPIIPVDKNGLIKESDLKEWFDKYTAKPAPKAMKSA